MAKTPFTLKSGNKLGASTFKMMGSSSPMHQEETKENLSKEETKENLSKENQIILNNLTENKTKDPKENATTISNTYGGTWKQDPRTLTNSETNKQVIANQWKNKQGLTVLQAAQKKQELQKILAAAKTPATIAAMKADRLKFGGESQQ